MDDNERRALVMELVGAALAAAGPVAAVARHLRAEGEQVWIGDRLYDLSGGRRLVVVGAGKAGAGMACSVERILGQRVSAGWVDVGRGYGLGRALERIHIHQAGHPLPDAAGLEGTREIRRLLAGLDEGDLVIVLLSGGASALLEQPVPGLSLEEIRQLTQGLLRSGATIVEMNAVRKHLSQVKGGQLLRWVGQAQVEVLVLSDVVGSHLDVIGSGPCAPDPTTFGDAWDVLARYGLAEGLSPALLEHLGRGRRGEVAETPKPGDALFERVHHTVIADNRLAGLAAVERARARGFQAMLLTTFLEGEASQTGRLLAALGKEVACYGQPLNRPACLVLGGETTVTVRGGGRGGRNQEAALAAALSLDGWEDVLVATLATDGIDGPTDAAGALASGETVMRARALGMEARDYLAGNDAYTFFASLGDLIRTGPTGTNVGDLSFVLVMKDDRLQC